MAKDSESNPGSEPTLDYTEPHDIDRIHSSVTREKGEPRDGLEPISIWVVSLCGLALFVGGAYLTQFSGGFQWDVYSEYAGNVGGPPGSGGAAGETEEKKELTLMEIGERTYKGCIACHQANGMGQPGVFPPLVGSDWVVGNNKRLIAILLHGLQGPIEVNGAMYNGNMPAGGGASLNDEKIAGVLTYIRASWGNDAQEITPPMVAKVREIFADRTAQWTADELLAITEEVEYIPMVSEEEAAAEDAAAGEGEAAAEGEAAPDETSAPATEGSETDQATPDAEQSPAPAPAEETPAAEGSNDAA